MEGNNFTFNPRRYENHLSVFGRKVLNKLVHKWKSDQSGTQRSQHGYYRRTHSSAPNRTFLTFRDTEPPLPPFPTFDQMNYDDQRDDTCIDFNFMEPNISRYNTAGEAGDAATPTSPPPVQSSQALPAAISSCELINPVIEGHGLFTEPTHNFNFKLSPDQINNADNENDIDWDNMFDTELFSSDTAEANAQLAIKQVESPPNAINIQLPRDNENNKEKNRKNKTKGKTKDNERNKSKGKNPSPTDTIKKKVMKVSAESKVSYRKQRYTKAVKNWLSSVELTRTLHSTDGADEPPAAGETGSEHGGAPPNRKVIQAQLANKDGIMKFRKPNNQQTISDNPEQAQDNVPPSGVTTETSAVESQRSTAEQNTPATNITTEKTRKENKSEKTPVKDKKGKPKFGAPIKSQTPVEDEQYQITTVEASNIERCMETITSGDDGQLVAVLLYRDGLCQLHEQHSAGRAEPEGFIVNAGEHFYIFKGEGDFSREALHTMLEKNTIVCYDGKSLLMYLKATFELDIHRLTTFDAMIGGNILEADRPPGDFTQLQQLVSVTAKDAGDAGSVECAHQQSARLCLQLRLVARKLAQLLEEDQLGHVFYDIEMKLVPIIADMELGGVSVDSEELRRMEEAVAARMRAAEDACHEAAGRAFQVSSPAQVRALVYEELALDRRANLAVRATLARHDKSTSEAMLRSLAAKHPLPRLVLQYRHLHKAHATFLAGIQHHDTGGLLKPTWLQAAAATGRIACANPNLQAIPKEPFRLDLFPEHTEHPAEIPCVNLRGVYRARAGCSLLAADFRHLECRVFAHHAADHELRAALHHSADLFRLLAAKWLQKEVSAVSPSTKHVVYASLYGAGVRTLADILRVGYEHALAVYTSFNRCFPSLKRFGSSVVSGCAAARGRLRSLAGRARRLHHIASAEPALRAHAERQAVNFIVQGSAADLCKLAMVGASSALRAARPALAARLLLQIHDELVWEVPHQHLHAAAVIIKRAMEECGLQSGMQERLPVALSVGPNWGEMTPYHLE